MATTNPGGAGKWRAEYSETLRDKRIVIVPDADQPGRRHALTVVSSLLGVATEVRMVELPGAKDTSAWAAQGGSRESLMRLVQDAEPITRDSLERLRAKWFPAQGVATEMRTSNRAPDGGSLIITSAAEIKPEPISWCWPGRIARGKLSLLAGHPGVGKSQLALGIAATLSRGVDWPDGAQCLRGDSLILSAEDDAADTIVPRLLANGADLTRVHIIDGVRAGYTAEGREVRRELCLADDIDKIAAALEGIPNAALVVIDPLGAYLGTTDSHRDGAVRGLLAPLAAFAAEHHVAVLGVTHLNKAANTEAISRITGSIAFIAAARSVWLVGKDPDDDGRRLFVPLKNNLGSDQTGLAFELKPVSVTTEAGEIPTTFPRWFQDEITTSAAKILAAGGTAGRGAAGRGETLKSAESFLSELLAEGPLPSSEVKQKAAEAMISPRTLARAKETLGVTAYRVEFGAGGRWFCTLPKDTNSPNNATNENLASLAKTRRSPPKNAKSANPTELALLEGSRSADVDQGRPESGVLDDLDI